MTKSHRLYLPIAIVGGLLSCTWVKTTPSAEQVRIVPADRVSDCQRLGTISSFTQAKVAGVKRKAVKVQTELETLARREAVDMGADTIVPAEEIKDGRQSFIAYRCLKQ